MRSPWPPLLLVLGVAAVVALAIVHTDETRERAEAALSRGMPPREAELARGFVLGRDEGIDARTVEDFRRAGLSHLLAVSGQNVALLALLAIPVLAALGIPLRMRLVWVLGLIAVYVPLAGAGPSIQRAGTMGALAVLATLAGRRTSRFYALALAAILTLAVDPHIAADVGWQLSFAAVLGILLMATPLRAALLGQIGAGSWQRVLAEGSAMTIAATVATAPLIAFHFGAFSTMTLVANLLALPAVAPAMWLGMLTAAAGQFPALPVEPLNALNALLLAYIAQIAAWCGRPSWAYLQVRLGGTGLAASYGAMAGVAILASRLKRRWRIATLRKPRPPRFAGRAAAGAAIASVTVALAWVVLWPTGGTRAVAPLSGLRITVLDIGQGDAILLQPAGAPAILVDGGPPGEDLVGRLRAAGVEQLGAALVTHDQSDHAAGVEELLGRLPVHRLLYAVLGRRMLAEARAAGVRPQRIAAGGELHSGDLRLSVLWPPPELLDEPPVGDDPNRLAVVLLARWRDFSMLLTADAEAEATPIEVGPVDVLKVAHHGSDDAGLGELLDQAAPRLAVISVSEDNPFGHPTPATLSILAAHGVPTLRTDRDGTIVLDVRPASFRVDLGA
ncbi:MAG TPA: ComEC/Rec2 family competence protein [Solirubrobacterales bacterium]|jgi:competence protein ComEC